MSIRLTVSVAAAVLCGAGGALPALAATPPASVAPVTPAAPATPAAPVALISQPELLARLERKDPDLVVLDVRTAAEYAAGHVPGARNVSHDEIAARLGELTPLHDKEVVLYCRSGRRSALAADVLRQAGFAKLLHLDGDYLAWQAAQRPVETSGPAETRDAH